MSIHSYIFGTLNKPQVQKITNRVQWQKVESSIKKIKSNNLLQDVCKSERNPEIIENCIKVAPVKEHLYADSSYK